MESCTEREPEWDDGQRAWFLALGEFEKHSLCPVCGGLKAECQSIDAEGSFHVPPPTRCHRRTAIDLASKEYEGVKNRDALMFAAIPRGQRP